MKASSVVALLRFGTAINREDLFTVQDIADAVNTARADLQMGEINLDSFIRLRASGSSWQQLLSAADNEELGTLADDTMRICGGDFMNLYAWPALVYGIAIGLSLAEPELLEPQSVGGVR